MNIRPAKQLWLPFDIKGGLFTSKADTASPVEEEQIMEKVVDRDNLLTALRDVKRNGGSPGIDGMTVKELPEYLKRKWPKLRGQLMSGTYEPLPVRRVEIPKPGGGIRQLGIPTVLDRFIQQALLQVLQQDWDGTFSESSLDSDRKGVPTKPLNDLRDISKRYMDGSLIWILKSFSTE